jgi:hypothetical protein
VRPASQEKQATTVLAEIGGSHRSKTRSCHVVVQKFVGSPDSTWKCRCSPMVWRVAASRCGSEIHGCSLKCSCGGRYDHASSLTLASISLPNDHFTALFILSADLSGCQKSRAPHRV